MAVLTRDEFFARLNERLGSDTSDDSISFLEDMTDTFNDLETRANNDGKEWERKYKELDETWKKRYRHRFFNGTDNRYIPKEDEGEEYSRDDITVEDLFTENEKKEVN